MRNEKVLLINKLLNTDGCQIRINLDFKQTCRICLRSAGALGGDDDDVDHLFSFDHVLKSNGTDDDFSAQLREMVEHLLDNKVGLEE